MPSFGETTTRARAPRRRDSSAPVVVVPTTTEDRVRLPSSALLLAVPHSAARRASADLRAHVQSTVATIDLGYMKSI